MKLLICFKDLVLGEFFERDGKFVFKANSKNVKRAEEKGYVAFHYGFEKDFVCETIPNELLEFLPSVQNSDLLEMANVQKGDSVFCVLWKLAGLDLAKPDFHINAK